jgi:polysaccharide biosynthesis transport protein
MPPRPDYISEAWSLLWRAKLIIAYCIAAALVAACLFIILVPHQFTAFAELLIEPSDLRAAAKDLTSTAQMSDEAMLRIESQVQVLTSDSVLRRVVAAERLDQDPEFVGQSRLRELIDSVFSVFSKSGDKHPDTTQVALAGLRRKLQVKRTDRTFTVVVRVTSLDPEKAARIANSVTKAYLDYQTEVRSLAARQVSESLSSRLSQLENRVREAEDRVEAFKARNNIVGASGQLVNEQQLSELNKTLAIASYRTAEAKARFEQIQRFRQEKVDVGALPEAVRSATISALRAQYAETVRREAEQMAALGPRHPSVVESKAQVKRLQQMINEEISRVAVAVRSEYESELAKEEALHRRLNSLKQTAISTNEAMIKLRELERKVQANRAVYESFLVRARETAEQERLDTKNIQVISAAAPPLGRSWPPSTSVTLLGAIFAGVAAGAGIFSARLPQRRRATPEDETDSRDASRMSDLGALAFRRDKTVIR